MTPAEVVQREINRAHNDGGGLTADDILVGLSERGYSVVRLYQEGAARWGLSCETCGGTRRVEHDDNLGLCPSSAEQLHGPTYCPSHPCPECAPGDPEK